jgi:hypothetical protein
MTYAWVAALLVPPVILLCDATLLRRRLGMMRGALLSVAAIFAIVVGTAVLYGRHLDAELAAYDLDGDGIFAGVEATPEQHLALLRVTNDLSRNLAPVTGGVFGAGYSALVFGGAAAIIHARRRWKSAA